MGPYSYTKKLFSKMSCLQLDLIFQNGRLKNSAESENVPQAYISVTSHHMRTNNGSTPGFSGTENVLVA